MEDWIQDSKGSEQFSNFRWINQLGECRSSRGEDVDVKDVYKRPGDEKENDSGKESFKEEAKDGREKGPNNDCSISNFKPFAKEGN